MLTALPKLANEQMVRHKQGLKQRIQDLAGTSHFLKDLHKGF